MYRYSLKYIGILLAVVLTAFFCGCKKYLDEKTNKSLAKPSTLKDLQALLDNDLAMNYQISIASDGCVDDYYLTDDLYNAISSEGSRQGYIWEDGIYTDESSANEWSILYQQCYYANIVLETINKIDPAADPTQRKKIKAEALFFRARAFYSAVSNWAKIYDEQSAKSEPGIPLRLESDFNKVSVRATLFDTYAQIIADLNSAIDNFPNLKSGDNPNRPSKAAAYALLSRAYLDMGKYEKALEAAENSLSINNSLINFNSLNPLVDFPISQFNAEVIFSASGAWEALAFGLIDTTLYKMYDAHDLRKTLFFGNNEDGTHYYRGSYDGGYSNFCGIATDELYLIKAECQVRTGSRTEGLKTLDALLVNRYQNGTYEPKTGLSDSDALKLILAERRKELIFRNLRWQTLKRLNKESMFQVTLIRKINQKEYILPPNDPRYALAIPQAVILNSGLKQNER